MGDVDRGMTELPDRECPLIPSLRARAEIRLREKPQRGKNRKGGRGTPSNRKQNCDASDLRVSDRLAISESERRRRRGEEERTLMIKGWKVVRMDHPPPPSPSLVLVETPLEVVSVPQERVRVMMMMIDRECMRELCATTRLFPPLCPALLVFSVASPEQTHLRIKNRLIAP